MNVFVLDKHKKPLMPCSSLRAHKLLNRGRAVVHKIYPFTIRLKDRIGGDLQPLALKLDPGSKHTGIAIVREAETVDQTTGEIAKQTNVVSLIQLDHRGSYISKKLTVRAAYRRNRRSRNTRYRESRFLNRTKHKGWLAPSLQHRVDSTINLVNKLRKLSPITRLSQELVKFDMQLIGNPEISGIEYQQGTLYGYEIKEFILEKHGRKCIYCNKEHVPLQLDHVRPKSRGGNNSVHNLVPACGPCNLVKNNMPIEQFLVNKPELLKKILAQLKRPLKDAAAVNSTRWVLFNALKATSLPVEVASGGKTKYNRKQQSIPKSHALDAVCVGNPGMVHMDNIPTLIISCMGRGMYQRTKPDKYGFPRCRLSRHKSFFGFQTGDIVKAIVPPTSKFCGEYIGRIAVRHTGQFDIDPGVHTYPLRVNYKHCKSLQRNDGHKYKFTIFKE